MLSLTAVRHQKSIDGVVISKSPLGAAQGCVCVCFFLLDCVQGRPTVAAQMGYYLYKSARALFLSCWLCLVQRHRRVSFLLTFRGQKKKNLAILFFCHPSPWRCPFAFQVWLEGRTKIHKFFFFWVRSRFIYLQNDSPPGASYSVQESHKSLFSLLSGAAPCSESTGRRGSVSESA